jgi:alpha-methylacyl-CoA racemase
MASDTQDFKPLRGICVLDLSRYLPGPYLTRILADLGANVIKVESPFGGDPMRHLPPMVGDHTAAFSALNYGKRSIALNLKESSGAKLFLALAQKADVLVESFRPGVMAKYGLAYETLKANNPRLIHCAMTGYGSQGPLRAAAGHDLNYLARAGILEMLRQSDGHLCMPGVQLADIGGGSWAGAIGILAALLERGQNGEGRFLDLSLTRSVMGLMAMEFPRRINDDPDSWGEGLLCGSIPAYNIYETADGRFMALSALEEKFWNIFCETINAPHLRGQGLFTGEGAQKVKEELGLRFKEKTMDEWCAVFAGKDACCEPIHTPEEAMVDPGVGEAGVDLGGVRALSTDVGVAGCSADSKDVPALGADAQDVFAELNIDQDLVEAAGQAGALLMV